MGGCNDGSQPWHGVRPMLKNGKFQQMLSGQQQATTVTPVNVVTDSGDGSSYITKCAIL